MLRSAATPNRTDVHVSPEMKQPTTRPSPATLPRAGRWAMHSPNRRMRRPLRSRIRLFEG